MTHDEAREHMLQASAAITVAANILRPYLPLFEQFDREQRDMESVGAILNPSLYLDPERRAVAAIMAPLYAEARKFIATYDAQLAASADALGKAGR